jgi:predicted Zn-dependent peptidase
MRFSYRKSILEDGTRVLTESSRSSGSVALGFWVNVGSSSEPPGLRGVSHFIEHMLFKGTGKRSAFEIANALESVGGSIDAYTGRESTAYVSRCLPEHLRRAVDVIGDMLSDPLLKPGDIALEKGVICEEIRNYQDTPEEVVHDLLARSVCGSDSISSPILGNLRSVSGFSRRKVLSFFRHHYVPERTLVAAVGKVDHSRLASHVSRLLKIRAHQVSDLKSPRGMGLPRVHHERRRVSQCYICLGAAAPRHADPRRYPIILLSTVLGGGMTSRLFQEVRERLGLAYSVYCSCEFYRETGIFFIFLAVDPKNARKATRKVAAELKRLKRHGLRPGELRSVKQQLKGSLVLGLESSSARMSRLARQEIYRGGYVKPEESLKGIMRAGTDRIMAEADLLLRGPQFSLVTVGPTTANLPTADDLDF